MTRARTVAHQLLEDGPEEEVNPREFINRNSPEFFAEEPLQGFREMVAQLSKIGVLEMLEKKYEPQVIGYAVMAFVLQRQSPRNSLRALRDLKRWSEFRI